MGEGNGSAGVRKEDPGEKELRCINIRCRIRSEYRGEGSLKNNECDIGESDYRNPDAYIRPKIEGTPQHRIVRLQILCRLGHVDILAFSIPDRTSQQNDFNPLVRSLKPRTPL